MKVGIPSPDERLQAYPHQFSGGMRQRVAIAIALLNSPDLIIADEPTTALDVTIQGQILYEMQKLTRETGTALIWITHDLSVDRRPRRSRVRDVRGPHRRAGHVRGGARRIRRIRTRRACSTRCPPNNERGQRLKQIPGMTPSLLDLPPGCPFRERCSYADAECEVSPEMRPAGGAGQTVRCFHPLVRAA